MREPCASRWPARTGAGLPLNDPEEPFYGGSYPAPTRRPVPQTFPALPLVEVVEPQPESLGWRFCDAVCALSLAAALFGLALSSLVGKGWPT